MTDHFDKNNFNKIQNHPLQSFEWGEFRKKTQIKVIRFSEFQLTIHKIPHLPLNIGYFPKGKIPTKEIIEKLKKIGKEENCIFIQLEPEAETNPKSIIQILSLGLRNSAHPLFTKYTFQLDLTKPEDELLKSMHSKTRYNTRLAEKRGVKIKEDDSDKAFQEYLRLTKETTNRQGFFAHNEKYHRLMWKNLRAKNKKDFSKNELTAHLLTATYKNKTLVSWILFVFHDTLYYPYGASSSESREVMASNLMMWEAIKFGKRLGLKKFDMWGALGPNPDPKDPWYGFHRFKEGYGGKLVEFVGSYDLVINPLIYSFYKTADRLRWILLRLKK